MHHPSEISDEQTDSFIPGRGQADPAPRHPFAVLQQGDLPARAGVQRVRRLRQAALRSAGQQCLVGRRAESRGAGVLRQGSEDIDHPRQRYRHERRGGGGAPGHHRQEWHARIPGAARRREEEGCQPDRPVRRGLLFRLHRRRPHHRVVTACRGASCRRRALEQRRRGRVRGRGHRQARARHRRDPAPARGRGGVPVHLEAEVDHQQVFRPHLAADPDEEGERGTRRRRNRC